MKPPTIEDARRFGGCLNLSHNVKKIGLASCGMSDEACKVMFSTLSSGALDKLQILDLNLNQIGDSGLSALATVLTPGPSGKGALASLKELELGGNQIGDDGLKALAEACASRALDKLQVSWRPTALSPCPETFHVHSPDSEDLFDVPYADG